MPEEDVGRRRVTGVIADAWALYATQWRSFARRLVSNADTADATVQEALLRTLSARPALETPAEADRYLKRAIRNTVYSRFRRAPKTRLIDPEAPDCRPTPLQRVLREEDSAARRRQGERALAALRDLPAPVRRAMELRFFSDPPKTFREIGEVEGVPLTTIQGRITRGQRLLARALEEGDAR